MFVKFNRPSPIKRKPVGLRQTILYLQEVDRQEKNLRTINLETILEEDQNDVKIENFTEK